MEQDTEVRGIVITRHDVPVAVLELLGDRGFTRDQGLEVAARVGDLILEVVGSCLCGRHSTEVDR